MLISKALYGLLKSALLFYLKLSKDLKDMGFVINPYDPCVANKMIQGHQMTVCWHVDNLKVSHKHPIEITKFAIQLLKIYGEDLTVHRGKVHDYLGVDFDFGEKGKVKVSMIKYLQGVLDAFPEVLPTKHAATPASNHLFTVRDKNDPEYSPLPEKQARQFHHTVAQLLFMSTRARRDIQTAVGFLTTRVKAPDKDDWAKLRHTLVYLPQGHPPHEKSTSLSTLSLVCSVGLMVPTEFTGTQRATPGSSYQWGGKQLSVSQESTS